MTAPAPYASWTADGLAVLLREVKHSLMHIDRADGIYGDAGREFREVRRAAETRKHDQILAVIATRSTLTHSAVEDTYVCAHCDRVVANVEDHASRCTVQR